MSNISINNKEPNSGRLQKEDNSVVNIADLAAPITTTHHTAATIAANGTDAIGLLGKKTLEVSIKATAGATFLVKFYKSIDGSSFAPVQGCRDADFTLGVSASASAVVANNTAGEFYEEQWSFDIPGTSKFRVRIDSLSGTNAAVTVISTAIA